MTKIGDGKLTGALVVKVLIDTMSKAAKKARKVKPSAMAGLVILAAAIAVLVGCIWLLSQIKTEDMLYATGAIALLFIVMGTFTKGLSKVSFGGASITGALKMLAGFAIIVVGMLALVGVLGLLYDAIGEEIEPVMKSGAKMFGFIGEALGELFRGIFRDFTITNFIQDLVGAAKGLSEISDYSKEIDFSGILKVAGALVLMGASGIVLGIAGAIDALVSLTGLGGEGKKSVITRLVEIMKDVAPDLAEFSTYAAKINGTACGEGALGIGAIAVAAVALDVAGFINALANLIPLKDEANKSVIETLVDTMIAVAPKLTELSNKAGGINSTNLKNAGEGIAAIALAAGALGAVGGFDALLAWIFADENGSVLETFVDTLNTAMPKIVDVVTSAEKIPSKDLTNAKQAFSDIASIAGSLTTAGVKEDLWQAVLKVSPIQSFAKSLAKAVPNLKTFVTSMGGAIGAVGETKILALTTLIASLASLNGTIGANYGADYTWNSEAITPMGAFAKDIPDLSDSLSKFVEKVNATPYANPFKLNTFLTLMDALAKLNTILPEQGGIKQGLVGTVQSLGDFAEGIPKLGTALQNFVSRVAETPEESLKQEKIDAFIALANQLVQLEKDLPRYGGFVGVVLGNITQLTTFASGVTSLGTSLQSFYTSTNEIDPDKVLAAATVAEALTRFYKLLPKLGGVVGWWEGDEDLDAFGTGIGMIAEGLGKFSEKFKMGFTDEEEKNLRTALSFVKQFADMATELSQGYSPLPDLASSITSFFVSSSWKDLTDKRMSNFMNVPFDKLSAALNEDSTWNVISKMADLSSMLPEKFDFKGFARNIIDFFTFSEGGYFTGLTDWSQMTGEGIDNFLAIKWEDMMPALEAVQALATAANTFEYGAEGSLDDLYYLIQDFGNLEWSQDFADDMAEGFSPVVTSFANTITAIKDYYYSFYSAGQYVVAGLIEGINSRSWVAMMAAASLAVNIRNTVYNILGIASPSKEFAKIGMFIDQGLANGLMDYSVVAVNASEKVAEETIQTASSTLTQLSDILNSDMEFHPVIRPVIDMTDINNSESSINGLFANGRRLNVSNTVSRIGTMTVERNDSTNVGSVVNAIDVLTAKVDALGEKMRGMQVVMDSGVLAGELTDRIDMNLGSKIVRHKRGM